jgi:hypothetical protein
MTILPNQSCRPGWMPRPRTENCCVAQPPQQGLVYSVNLGIEAAAPNDVVLLNSDTEVPTGWLARLAGHAYARPRIASVSPFSNHATICGYPSNEANTPAFGLGVSDLDAACRAANSGRSVELPTSVGFCMYIRRTALAETGLFDAEAFGRGYGEENDFCLRATARGWRHLLACDTFVYHQGSVSFGAGAPAAERQAMAVLERRYPSYKRIIAQHVKRDAVAPYRVALTLELFRRSSRPTILMLAHDLGGGVRRHIVDLVRRIGEAANCLLLQSTTRGAALSVPALPGHPELVLPPDRLSPSGASSAVISGRSGLGTASMMSSKSAPIDPVWDYADDLRTRKARRRAEPVARLSA